MITIANAWEILPTSDRQYLHLQHIDHPGYITIKADDEGFVVDVFPDVGNESVATTCAPYNELTEEGT